MFLGPAAVLALVTSAQAQTGDFPNLSFTGDGETPSALERFSASASRSSPTAQGGAGSGPGGDEPVHAVGRFLGFAEQTEGEWARDAYDVLGLEPPQQTSFFTYGPLYGVVDGYWVGATRTTWLLEPDHTLVVEREIRGDAQAVRVNGGAVANRRRWLEQSTYTVGLASDWMVRRWPYVVTSSLNSDPRGPNTPDALSTWTTTTTFDTNGNLTLSRHEGALPSEKVEVRTTWVSNATRSVYRPAAMETWSAAIDSPSTLELVEKGIFQYDGLTTGVDEGNLSAQAVCSGIAGDHASLCATTLDWAFTRTSRGAVSRVDAPLDRDVVYGSFGFGDFIPRTVTNALGHVTTKAIDDLGNVISELDPNGVDHATFYDPLGRPVETWIAAPDGPPVQLTSTTYDDVGIRTTTTTTFRYDPVSGDYDGGTASASVFDGFGQPFQQWRETAAGWVAQEEERDVTGAVRRTSEPWVSPVAFDAGMSGVERGETRTWAFPDILGETIHAWSTDSGVTRTDHPTALETRTRMEDAYLRVETVDTLGRLVKVAQGQEPTTTVVGTYAYDGRDRVKQFTDGNNDQWRYRDASCQGLRPRHPLRGTRRPPEAPCDGAGRIRQVTRRPDVTGAWQDYYGFTWTGPDPAAMYEGTAGQGAAEATWTYDLLGRTLTKSVTDPLVAGGVAVYGWEWDQQSGCATCAPWKGVRHKVTDPNGSATYEYGASSAFGHLGQVTRTSRTTGAVTQTFVRSYDEAGRVLSETWPSGKVVTTAYAPSGEVASQSVDGWTVTYTRDPLYGVDNGWQLAKTGQPTWTQVDDLGSRTYFT